MIRTFRTIEEKFDVAKTSITFGSLPATTTKTGLSELEALKTKAPNIYNRLFPLIQKRDETIKRTDELNTRLKNLESGIDVVSGLISGTGKMPENPDKKIYSESNQLPTDKLDNVIVSDIKKQQNDALIGVLAAITGIILFFG